MPKNESHGLIGLIRQEWFRKMERGKLAILWFTFKSKFRKKQKGWRIMTASKKT